LDFQVPFFRVQRNKRVQLNEAAVGGVHFALSEEHHGGEAGLGGDFFGRVFADYRDRSAEPGLVLVRIACRFVQPADRPVEFGVAEQLLRERPIGGQVDEQFGVAVVFLALGYVHGLLAHAAGEERELLVCLIWRDGVNGDGEPGGDDLAEGSWAGFAVLLFEVGDDFFFERGGGPGSLGRRWYGA